MCVFLYEILDNPDLYLLSSTCIATICQISPVALRKDYMEWIWIITDVCSYNHIPYHTLEEVHEITCTPDLLSLDQRRHPVQFNTSFIRFVWQIIEYNEYK